MTDRATIHLSDLCDLVAEQVNPHNQPDGVYVGLEHVASRRFIRSGAGKASDVRSSKSSFKPDDVLYGKLRPYLDKAVLAHDEGICTTELLVLRAKEKINPRFLVGVVHSPAFVEHAILGTTGVQHPRTSWSHIQEFQLPEFTRDEQNRIAELLWLVYEAIAACESSIETSHILKRAAMRTLFTRGLHGEAQKETEIGPMPKSWKLSRVSDAVTPLHFDRRKRIPKSAYVPDGRWPVVDQGQKYIAAYTDDYSRLIEPDEPVIIFGDHTRIFKFVDFAFVLGADGTKPLLSRASFYPKYLFHSLCNLEIPDRGYNRHYTVLSEMLVGAPSLNEQYEIVAILDAIDRKADLHHRKRAILDNIFKALLYKLIANKIRIADFDLSVPHDSPIDTSIIST